MDFTNRDGRSSQPSNHQVSHDNGSQGTSSKKKRGKAGLPFGDLASSLLLIAAAVVLLGLTWLLIFSKDKNESRYVNTDKLQAVFLNGGQVYFGSITGINDKYVRLNNIYYLRVNQQVQPEQGADQAGQDISLVKLGCELHGPEDQMIINQEQVMFWENLKSDGKVTEAVRQYVETHKNGQDCTAQSGSTGNNNVPTPTPSGNDDTTDTTEETEPAETP